MSRSPLALAALATAAVPGLDACAVRAVQTADDYDVAIVTDSAGVPWTVCAPRTDSAGASLEAEAALLDVLGAFEADGRLTFSVPRIAGWALLPEGGRAVVYPVLAGRPLNLDTLEPGPGMAADLGRVIASVHELPPSVVEGVGMPVYTAQEYRARRLTELDEAAGTGMVPVGLLRRWESALEDVALWRFRPVVTHGDLGPEQVLVSGGRVVAVTDWSSAQVADPADDLAWLVVGAPEDAVDAILEAYELRRSDSADPHLLERAQLVGELALARWLLYGVRSRQDDVITDAVGMLADLDESAREEERDED